MRWRSAAPPPAWPADPVPQALLITAIVVAFAATAVTVALLLRLIESTDSAIAGQRAAADD